MKKSVRGSVTVEAALVMPLIVFIIFALLYLTFFLHDKSRIQNAVDKTLHKAALTVKHEADISSGEVYYEDINNRGVFYLPFGSTEEEENKIWDYVSRELQNGLLIADISNIKVNAGKFKIQITVEADMPVSLPGIRQFLKNLSRIKIVESSQIHNPTEQIRVSEVILDTGLKIKGVEALKDKLDNVLK
jgi:hypothetical protein